MAKVTGPLHSSEARGRVGNLIYNTWRGLRVVKQADPAPPAVTPARQAHRILVQEQGQRWRTLSDDQRAAWQAYADTHLDIDWTGQPVRLAGYHWYVRCRTRAMDAWGEASDDPPDDSPHNSLAWLSLQTYPGELNIGWDVTNPAENDDWMVQLWLAGPASPGRKLTLHHAKVLSYEPPSVYSTGVTGLQIGRYTAFARLIHRSGTASPYVTDTAIISEA